eukprot:TRINITY_DN3747_c0_g2_i1.p1 TRINITY_DN3747_c0_g2~~TRINITY_DN3747_c0_g2_i1.p1  ORF type:complete len:783 (+),score=83.79 TRINITY_DN3747_c0_g2_i1:27-2375(+)
MATMASHDEQEMERRSLLAKDAEKSEAGNGSMILAQPPVHRVRQNSKRSPFCKVPNLVLLAFVVGAGLICLVLVTFGRSGTIWNSKGEPFGLEFEEVDGEKAGLLRSVSLPNLCVSVPIEVRRSFRERITRTIPTDVLELSPCELAGTPDIEDQRWVFTKFGHVRSVISDACMSAVTTRKWLSKAAIVALLPCDTSRLQQWTFLSSGMLQNIGTGDCVRFLGLAASAQAPLEMGNCDNSYGARFAWVPKPFNMNIVGFVQNVVTKKCLHWSGKQLSISACDFHKRAVGNRWRVRPDSLVDLISIGKCLVTMNVALGQSELTLQDCNSPDASATPWYWDPRGFIRKSGESKCLDAWSEIGHLTLCSGHSVVERDCKQAASDSMQEWRFIPLSGVSPPPIGSPDRPLPKQLVSYGAASTAVLMIAGHVCNGKSKDLGSARTLQECMIKANWASAKQLNYGFEGEDKFKCALGHDSSLDTCQSGWRPALYNVYKLDPLPEKELPFYMSMTRLALQTYYPLPVGTLVAGWEVRHQCNKRPKRRGVMAGTDFVTLFGKGDQCLLAFAGSDDVVDAVIDFEIKVKEICDAHFHGGFIWELIHFMQTDCWISGIAPMMASDRCAGRRVGLGHSMGGAIADALAYCANRKGSNGLKDIQPQAPTFTIDEIYTFGAPGIAKESLANGLSSDGCFKGRRFLNIDAKRMDPVPWITSLVDFVHPKLEVTWIYEDDFGEVVKTTLPCGGKMEESLPRTDHRCHLTIADHSLETYLYRLEELYGPPLNASGVVYD